MSVGVDLKLSSCFNFLLLLYRSRSRSTVKTALMLSIYTFLPGFPFSYFVMCRKQSLQYSQIQTYCVNGHFIMVYQRTKKAISIQSKCVQANGLFQQLYNYIIVSTHHALMEPKHTQCYVDNPIKGYDQLTGINLQFCPAQRHAVLYLLYTFRL